MEAVGCIVGVFYGAYLITAGSDETTWTISVAILALLCLAIIDTWLIYTVISFYQEIRKEAVQNQEAFPVDVEFYTKGYGDIAGRPNGVDQRNMTGYNEYGYTSLATNDGHQLHYQQQRDRTGPGMNNKVYDDLYNQYPPTASKNNQRVSFNLQSNQYLPSNSSNDMLYTQSNSSIQNQAYMGHDRPNRNVLPSSHFNYLSFD